MLLYKVIPVRDSQSNIILQIGAIVGVFSPRLVLVVVQHAILGVVGVGQLHTGAIESVTCSVTVLTRGELEGEVGRGRGRHFLEGQGRDVTPVLEGIIQSTATHANDVIVMQINRETGYTIV